MDILTLRNQIQTLLTNPVPLLGTYTFADAAGNVVATDYAIAVLTDGSYPPAGTQIAGLEVVIEPDSATKVEALLTESRVDTDIKITLKQWTAGETTVAATSVLIDGLAGLLDIRPRMPRSSMLDTIETQVIILKEPISRPYAWL